jgi:hypothetical protein
MAKAKAKKKVKMTPAEQSAAFKAMARELKTDERPESFDRLVKAAARPAKSR